MTTQQQDQAFGREFTDTVVQWVADNLNPEEVFTEKVLEQWAKNNGFVKVDELPAEVQELI